MCVLLTALCVGANFAMAASVEVDVFGGGGGMDCKVVEPVDGAAVGAVLLVPVVPGTDGVVAAVAAGVVVALVDADVNVDVSGVFIRVAAPVGMEVVVVVEAPPPPLKAVGLNRAIIYYGRVN